MKIRRVKLSDIAELTVGFVGNMAKQYKDEGVKFLRSLNIKPFSIVEDDLKYISREFNESLRKSILHENDLIIVRTGIPGTCCVVSKDYDGCNCADVVLVRPNLQVVNPHYLAAYINVWGKKQVEYNKVGAIQKHFNVKSAEEMLIDLPDLESQNKVAKILCDLNDKIISNEKINDYLEEMAKTIYDYWFVQFDFPDKNGKPYKSSGGTFKNGLPIGWNYVPIKNICNILSGFSFQSDDYVQNGKYKLLTIKNVQDTGINLDVDNYINILPENMPDFCKLDIGSILMSLTGNVGRVGILYDSNCLLNQRVSLMQAKNPIMTPFIYCLLKSSKMRYILESLATGTSQKNLSPIEAGNIMIPYDNENVKNFSKKVTPLIDSIITNLKENNNLTNLREWLLPMLMNGQATIEN
jgi:type I restriction enzyme S subunit